MTTERILRCYSQVFNSSDPPPKTTTPEEFIRMTKGITMATAKAVAAGNSCRQEDIIATANLSRRAITDMLHSCKVGGGLERCEVDPLLSEQPVL